MIFFLLLYNSPDLSGSGKIVYKYWPGLSQQKVLLIQVLCCTFICIYSQKKEERHILPSDSLNIFTCIVLYSAKLYYFLLCHISL